jgi:GcrA cell cycle regulator
MRWRPPPSPLRLFSPGGSDVDVLHEGSPQRHRSGSRLFHRAVRVGYVLGDRALGALQMSAGWTHGGEWDEQIVALHAEGLSIAAIAERVPVATKTISRRLQACGKKAPQTNVDSADIIALHAEGLSQARIAERVGMSESAVGRRCIALGLTRQPGRHQAGSPWPRRDDELRAHWAVEPALSHAAIGERMGLSKNSIIGRVRRLKLTPRPQQVSSTKAAHRKRAKRAATAAAPGIRETGTGLLIGPTLPGVAHFKARTPVVFGHVSACCWPLGDPGEPGFHFCGEPSVPSRPYCEEHCAIAYVPRTEDRRADAA